MLKTPPGLSKRRVESRPLDEAGAVFETLYKKYLSLDADNLQKQAENYLLKSFYNKSSVKNDFHSQSSEFSEPRKLNSTQSSKFECVANTNENFNKKTTFDLNDNSEDNKFTYKDSITSSADYKEDLKDLNDDLKVLKNDLRYLKDDLEDSLRNLDQLQLDLPQSNSNNNFEKEKKKNKLKDKVRFEDESSPTNLKSKKNKDNKHSYKDLVKNFKRPSKQTNKEDTRVYIDSSSDISEDSVESKEKQKNLITIEEYCDSEFDRVDEFLSPTNVRKKKVENRRSLLAKNRELNFVCTVCLLFQVLFGLALFGFFFLFYSFPYENNYWFVTVLFPFLVHAGIFYVIFTFTDYNIKRRFLVYTNDYTVDVLNKRLNRELCYKKLNKYSIWAERILVLLGLCIACLPVTFTNDFTTFSPKEYLYLSLIVVYVILHIGFTYYYFTIKFKKLLINTSDDDD